MMNGRFGSLALAPSAGEFFAGDELGDWEIASAIKRGAPVLRLRSDEPALSRSAGVDDPWACLSGTIRQTIATRIGASYRLGYEVCALDSYPANDAKAQADVSVGDVLIDGLVVQTVVVVESAPCLTRELYFTARSSVTVLSFATSGRNSVALRNVSLDVADLCEREVWHPELDGPASVGSGVCGCRKPQTTEWGKPIHGPVG